MPRTVIRSSAAVAVVALLALTAWGRGAPPIDWADLPAEPIALVGDVTVAECADGLPLLCAADPGGVLGGIEHLSYPLDTFPRLRQALSEGVALRAALTAETDEFHKTFAQDRAEGCPPGYDYVPDATRGALVAGGDGIRYGFRVLDADGDVVERTLGFMTVRDDAVHVLTAEALGEDACLEPGGFSFEPAELADFTAAAEQLVARSLLPPPAEPAVRTVPAGGNGVTYDEPEGPDDGNPVGPTAIAIDRDGVAWIADVEGERLVRVASDGTLLAPVDLGHEGIIGVIDLEVRGDGFVLVDMNPLGEQWVRLLDGAGRVTASHDLPEGARLEDGLSGLWVAEDGAVHAELRGGMELVTLLDAAGSLTEVEPVDGYVVHGRRYQPRIDEGRGIIEADGRRIEVRTDHELVGLFFLDARPDGTFTVIVDELLGVNPIQVDQTVRRYSPDGRLLESARHDLRSRHTVVDNPFAVTPEGAAVVLTTRPDHALVQPLRFTPRLPALFPPAEPVVDLSAGDAVGSAIALSQEAFRGGSVTTALLAREDVFADALASGGVQGILDVPLLLTPGGSLDDRVAAELDRLGVREVVVLGGTAAISPTVEDELRSAGMTVARHGGATRIDTAVALARATAAQTRRAVLVRADGPLAGQDFADALGAGALAAARREPVLLTPTAALAPQVADYLDDAGVTEVVVAGGTAAVSADVVTALESRGIRVDRAGGGERAETATLLAARMAAPTAAYVDTVVVVDGGDWVDGLASAALAARERAPVLLAAGEVLPDATRSYLDAAEQPPVVVCTPSVTAAACEAAAAAAGVSDQRAPARSASR